MISGDTLCALRAAENAVATGMSWVQDQPVWGYAKLAIFERRRDVAAEPPCVVVRSVDAEEVQPQSNVFEVEMRVALITLINEERVAEHDVLARSVKLMLDKIPLPGGTDECVVHGLYVASVAATDKDGIHGDVYSVRASVSVGKHGLVGEDAELTG